METEVPQVPARKKEPSKRGAAQKKALPTVSEISGSEDDTDLEVEVVKRKGGRKPAANAKAANPTAATKRRGPASKQSQGLGQKLLTEMLKPAEDTGISPEKKVRKMRASPFNKKSSSVLGQVHKEDEANESGSASTSESTGVIELPARARPQRANRTQTRYVLSDSESEKEDSDFAQDNDDDSDFAEDDN